MALTVNITPDPVTGGDANSVGDHFEIRGTLDFDSSYPTGGEAIAASDFGGYYVLLDLWVEATGAEVPKYDPDNEKVLLYTADGTEAVNASDQSAVSVRFLAKVK